MSPRRHRILVIGCGSIGERHVRTFLATGRTGVAACDNRPAIRQQMIEKYGVAAFEDWEAALADPAVTGVVVATPAPLHVDIAHKILSTGRHVLIEKPLAIKLAGTRRLLAARARSGKFTAVGYTRHCQRTFLDARDFIRSAQFGSVKHVIITTGQDFPAARPAYREIYYRDHAQGGGAIQDALTHMANAVEWILGPTTRVCCDAAHQVLAGVEVEDTVNVSARNGGALVSYALNQFQAPTESRLDFHAEHGSVRIEMDPERWGTLARGDKDWKWRLSLPAVRDIIYIAQANAFLDGCEGKPQPLCTLEEGIQTLRFNLAALQSWRQGTPVAIKSTK
ncbi:MAG: Gfo/Idh/MocA family oxidoreductase [Lacunisphaera sp.]|nr:Gfo/Idh/MocA family oxidoreductase [Lacunisphaera sp.]